MKLLKPLASLLFSIALSGCQTFQASDWAGSVTLPASGDCMSFNVISGRETRLAADNPECIKKKRRSVWIDSESWKMLRKDIQTNCQFEQCKQITGAFDGLFLAIDKALQQVPIK